PGRGGEAMMKLGRVRTGIAGQARVRRPPADRDKAGPNPPGRRSGPLPFTTDSLRFEDGCPMRTRTLLSAALCAATIGAGSAAGTQADEPAATGDLAKLQGQWTATFGSQNRVVVVTIKGTGATLAFTLPDGQMRESKGEIKIDEKAKPHKTLDWINFTTQSGD